MKSLADIRALFPALARAHNGLPVAYFDGPGGTQVPAPVVDAMSDYLLNHNANTHWLYPTSRETDAMLWQAREAMADFLNVTPHEVSFGNNMTTITFHLARALGRAWGPGDEVVVTELDHHANVAPWQALARERGITVRTARMIPEQGVLDWDHLASLVSSKTRLLAIGAASNALGTINDIPRAAKLARGVGALLFVDAVHYAAHGVVDAQAWDCDFLACSSYKFYGPHAGVLYARRDVFASLDVPKLEPAPTEVPERIETGTQNHEGIVGTGAAIDFLASLGDGASRRERLVTSMQALHRRGDTLFGMLWEGLTSIPRVRVFGLPPGGQRTPTVSFVVEGKSSDDVALELANCGVFASNGDFYATTIIERLGHASDGVVRAGCACYTTEDEVTRLVNGVRELAR
ncbi:MAG: cysteine desulfurase-like protein [Cytophagaceae bacterium]|nr:cysteine desulfurase-like protein [Gemmatimonadaceae bacterium]